jgi:hypothetical protein
MNYDYITELKNSLAEIGADISRNIEESKELIVINGAGISVLGMAFELKSKEIIESLENNMNKISKKIDESGEKN